VNWIFICTIKCIQGPLSFLILFGFKIKKTCATLILEREQNRRRRMVRQATFGSRVQPCSETVLDGATRANSSGLNLLHGTTPVSQPLSDDPNRSALTCFRMWLHFSVFKTLSRYLEWKIKLSDAPLLMSFYFRPTHINKHVLEFETI
jgi:hypothetical protein